jgi:DUF177 domain-containing protein
MLEIHEPVPTQWLADALGDADVEPTPDTIGEVDVFLTTSGRDVVVRGTVRASVSLPCARCLNNTDIRVEGELGLLLVPGKAPAVVSDKDDPDAKPKGKGKKGRRGAKGDDDGHVIDPNEVELDTYVGDEVVLDHFLREAILLELPIFPLCSEACPGIGAVPSETADSATEEENIDPRLAPLLELKKKSRV